MALFDIIAYEQEGVKIYTLEDLKLSLGNTRFQEFLGWLEANVPPSRRMKDEVAVTDVERFLYHRRRTILL